jgi:Galactose oxidase, central domain
MDTAGISTTEIPLLDPSSGVLTPTGALGTARVGHTATLLQDGRVLVTGGTDANGNALAAAELYKAFALRARWSNALSTQVNSRA